MPFPPPWTVQHNESAFWIEDASGHRFGYCYYEREGHHNAMALTKDEARRIASNIARLPVLLGAAEAGD